MRLFSQSRNPKFLRELIVPESMEVSSDYEGFYQLRSKVTGMNLIYQGDSGDISVRYEQRHQDKRELKAMLKQLGLKYPKSGEYMWIAVEQ